MRWASAAKKNGISAPTPNFLAGVSSFHSTTAGTALPAAMPATKASCDGRQATRLLTLTALPKTINFHLLTTPFRSGDGSKMNVDIASLKRPQGLFLAAAALRLVLFFAFPGLPELVAGRVEVSTPVNSFKRCKCYTPPLESIHLGLRGADPRNSTRRPFPLQPQRIALRWRRLPPSTAAAAALLPPPEFRVLAGLHLPPLHSDRPPERQCVDDYRRVRGSWVVCAVYLSAEGQEVERLGGGYSVRALQTSLRLTWPLIKPYVAFCLILSQSRLVLDDRRPSSRHAPSFMPSQTPLQAPHTAP